MLFVVFIPLWMFCTYLINFFFLSIFQSIRSIGTVFTCLFTCSMMSFWINGCVKTIGRLRTPVHRVRNLARIHSRKDSRQQNCDNLNGFSQLFKFIIQSYTRRIHGFLQNYTGRIQMDSRTWSRISDPAYGRHFCY